MPKGGGGRNTETGGPLEKGFLNARHEECLFLKATPGLFCHPDHISTPSRLNPQTRVVTPQCAHCKDLNPLGVKRRGEASQARRRVQGATPRGLPTPS